MGAKGPVHVGGQQSYVNMTEVNTDGGVNISGDVKIGGDVVGRDKVVHGDEVRGDKIGGDRINRHNDVNIENLVIHTSQTESNPMAKPEIEEKIRVDVAAPDSGSWSMRFSTLRWRFADQSLQSSRSMTYPRQSLPLAKHSVQDPGEIIRYRVAVSAPNCVIHGPSEYVFLLQPAQDSEPFFFQLAAKKAGRISILIQAYQEGDIIAAQTRVKIEAYVEAVT